VDKVAAVPGFLGKAAAETGCTAMMISTAAAWLKRVTVPLWRPGYPPKYAG